MRLRGMCRGLTGELWLRSVDEVGRVGEVGEVSGCIGREKL